MDAELRQLERIGGTQYYKALQRAGRLSGADLYLLAYCGESTQELLPCSWCRENYQNAPVVMPPLVFCPLCSSMLPKPWFEADWLPGLNHMFVNHILEPEKGYGDKCKQLQITAALALAKLEDKWLDNQDCHVEPVACLWHAKHENLKRYIEVIDSYLQEPTKDTHDKAWNVEVELYLPYAAGEAWRIMEEPWGAILWNCRGAQDFALAEEKKAAICAALVARLVRQ